MWYESPIKESIISNDACGGEDVESLKGKERKLCSIIVGNEAWGEAVQACFSSFPSFYGHEANRKIFTEAPGSEGILTRILIYVNYISIAHCIVRDHVQQAFSSKIFLSEGEFKWSEATSR